MTAIIDLAKHRQGTQYTARVLHNNQDDRRKHEDMGFFDGWRTAIDQFGKVAMALTD